MGELKTTNFGLRYMGTDTREKQTAKTEIGKIPTPFCKVFCGL